MTVLLESLLPTMLPLVGCAMEGEVLAHVAASSCISSGVLEESYVAQKMVIQYATLAVF